MPVSAVSTLPSWKAKNIKDICNHQYINNAHNHCAHFVAHVMSYSFGYTCKNQTGKGKGAGASIRVNELFAQCPQVGKWSDKPPVLQSCLAFITDAAHVNLSQRKMTDHPQKHIGIFANGLIYHYSNGEDKVVSDTPPSFESKFKSRYSGANVTLFFGQFPP